mgnify:CR=1 FL=1
MTTATPTLGPTADHGPDIRPARLAAEQYASHFADAHPAVPYLRAFAEASMVGGIADWFAVTALFRHPLGLPIPHTAIIPNNQERIAATIGVFVQSNFLTEEAIRRSASRRACQPCSLIWPSGHCCIRTRSGLPWPIRCCSGCRKTRR